jgi:hypothetical protein
VVTASKRKICDSWILIIGKLRLLEVLWKTLWEILIVSQGFPREFHKLFKVQVLDITQTEMNWKMLIAFEYCMVL